MCVGGIEPRVPIFEKKLILCYPVTFGKWAVSNFLKTTHYACNC